MCLCVQVDLAYDMATLLPDRPPNKAGRWHARLHRKCLPVLICTRAQSGLVRQRGNRRSRCPPARLSVQLISPSPYAGRVSVRSHAAFLNSSTSRWEALWGSWPAQAEFVDIVSPVYLSDRQT